MVEKIKYDDDCYETTTSKNSVIKSKCIVIAAGNGAFEINLQSAILRIRGKVNFLPY